LDGLFPDLFVGISEFLTVLSISYVARTCKSCAEMYLNPALWQMLCIREFGLIPPTESSQTTEIGLAQNTVSWQDFFVLMHCSDVLTWGTMGRLGHSKEKIKQVKKETEDQSLVSGPLVLDQLSHKGVKFLGKTAEVGSIAISRSGDSVYMWGSTARSDTPVQVFAADISRISGDRIVHCSCGHDSRFILVFSSGAVYWCGYKYVSKVIEGKDFKEISKFLVDPFLFPDEKPVWSVGSQSSLGGIITNRGRLFAWPSYGLESEYDKWMNTAENPQQELALELGSMSLRDEDSPKSQPSNATVYIIKPVDASTKEPFQIRKCGFGHKHFFAITTEGGLYQLSCRSLGDSSRSRIESILWERVPASEGLDVVDVDSGTEHHGFVTKSGDVYLWGTGAMGVLGRKSTDSSTFPVRVEFFNKQNLKVVAVGCGGYVSWNGGFTLFLLDDNRLFYCGKLGTEEHVLLPRQVTSADLGNRHILSISAGEDWAGIAVSKRG